MYRYHPEIEGLKVNENGTEIMLNGEPLKIRTSTNKYGIQTYVIINNKTINIGRLVAETWLGMPPHSGVNAQRIDTSKDYHYSNMQWRVPEPIHTHKLSDKQKKEIIKQLDNGSTLMELAVKYNVSDMTIHRIKKEFKTL